MLISACENQQYKKFESIILPVIPDKKIEIYDSVNKRDVKNIKYIVDVDFPAEELKNYYINYFKKFGLSNDKVIFFKGREWHNYTDVTDVNPLYILRRCDEWTDEIMIYIGLCMWYESSDEKCSKIYSELVLGIIESNAKDILDCNLTKLNVAIQKIYLRDIGIKKWRNLY
ncbi:MAG: hypothetical protein ACP5QK_08165 [Myxococcota bacterium]